MLKDIKKAENVDEILFWINNSNSLKSKKKRFLMAKNTNFYWASFNTDKVLVGFAMDNALMDE